MWADGRLLAFDIETTSVDVETARMVQAAQVYVGGGRPTDSTVLLINPGVPIPEEATAVHGITDEMAREGIDAPAAMDEFAHMIDLAISDRVPIVAYNARYDLTILDRELRRHGLKMPDWSALRVIDPLVIDKHLDRYRKGSRKLDALCEHHGALLDTAHDAGSDAISAARLAYVLGKRGEIVRRVWNAEMGREKAALVREWERVRGDLDALHAFQARLAGEQARGLREHFTEQGKVEEAASVVDDWPVVPFVGATNVAA
jgi:DNA polymerase-3 subunit epsilon